VSAAGLRRAAREVPLLAEVTLLLVAARLLVLVPFRRYRRLAGRPAAAVPADCGAVPAEGMAIARRVRWAIDAVSRRLPVVRVCLPQALAATWCLRRRGVASVLHLGVVRRPDGCIGGHAWLMCGSVVVTGAAARARATPMAAYA
jgi:hypothetical protein